jgi:hypothetical protein
VVADVVSGLVVGHAGHVVADADALIEGRQYAVADLVGEVGLAEQDGGERRSGIELVVGHEPDRVESTVVEDVAFVDEKYRSAAAFGGFGGECVAGLGDQGGGVEGGFGAQGCDDELVDASRGDGWVRDVDEVVAGAVDAVEGGACGHGLADADLARNHGDAAGVDAVGDAGGGLGVVGVAVQHAGGKVAPEWHAGKSIEALDSVQHGVAPVGEFGLSAVDGC